LDREVSEKRIAWTSQGRDRSKRIALNSRCSGQIAHVWVARKSAPDEHGNEVKESRVQFDVSSNRGGNNYLSSLASKGSCDCDDADIDMTYRMCCISVGKSPSYKVATLFDTGAHASFVNREVADWIGNQEMTDRQVPNRKRGWQEAIGTTVSLAGTSMSSQILGSVVFDLTF